MDASKLLDQYTEWFKSAAYITLAKCGFSSIAVPLLDRLNDYLQLFVKEEENGNIVITDGGNTISNLEMCGVDVSKGSLNREIIDKILRSKRLTLEQEDEIWSRTTAERFPLAMNEFLQAVLAIDALHEAGSFASKSLTEAAVS